MLIPHVKHLTLCVFRYDDMYSLNISYEDGSSKKSRSQNFTKSVSCFYDENGLLCMDLFEPEVIKLHNGLTAEKKEK